MLLYWMEKHLNILMSLLYNLGVLCYFNVCKSKDMYYDIFQSKYLNIR